MKSAEIFTKPSCPYCVKAKALLTSKKIPYVEYIIGVDGVTKETIEAKIGVAGSVKTVPQIFIDGSHIGGCDNLMEWIKRN